MFSEKNRFYYKHLSVEQLMLHKGAYAAIAEIGRKEKPQWKMEDLEKSCFADSLFPYNLSSPRWKAKLKKALDKVNEETPFLRYSDLGQHYAYELFLTEPEFWGSRGAPFIWAYIAREFTYDKLPMKEKDFTQKFKKITKSLGLNIEGENSVFIEEFSAGGMSSGVVSEIFCREALNILLQRLKKYSSKGL